MSTFRIDQKDENGHTIIKTTVSPFAAKTITLSDGSIKKLFKREHGIQSCVTTGTNIILFTIPYPWVKMTGINILYGEKLDTINLMVLDSTTGQYTTIPNCTLNQFGFAVNVAEGEHNEVCAYDADIYQGMQIKLVYNSQSAKTIGVNYNLSEVKT